MNARQWAQVPDELLATVGTAELQAFLKVRGWSVPLLELATERQARGIVPARRYSPSKPHNFKPRRRERRRHTHDAWAGVRPGIEGADHG